METRLKIQYQLDLTRDEWLVVSKALRVFAGDLPRDTDREIASALQEQMVRQKNSALKQMSDEADKHTGNIEAQRGRKT